MAGRIRTYLIFYALSLCVGMGVYNCRLEEGSYKEGTTLETNDSIVVWIEKSKDASLTPDQKSQLLTRARKRADQLSDDSLKLLYFSKLSLQFLGIRDSASFRDSARKVMLLAQKTGDTTRRAEAHWDLASFFGKNAVPDSSFYHYGEAYKLYEALGNKLLSGRMLYNMAVQQANVKDYTGSEITTVNAIELLKPLEAYQYLQLCYNNLAVVTKELGSYNRAIEYYDQAFEYGRMAKKKSMQEAELYNNIGNVYEKKGEHRRAIEFYNMALEDENLKSQDPEAFARILSNLAYNRMKSGQMAGVEDQFKMALYLRDSLKDLEGLSINHYGLADFYLTTGQKSLSLENARLALRFSEQIQNNKRLLLTYELLTRIDPENASHYANTYIQLSDSLQKEERRIRDKFARIQFETDEFIAENLVLARQRAQWIGIALGVFLLALAIFIIVYQRVKNQKLRFEQHQQQINQEIFDLMLTTKEKVEEGKHDEQKRISEELHDGVLGQMNGVRMVLLGLNKKNDDKSIEMRSQAIEKLQEVQEEIRTISHELSDAAYQKFHNFIVAIRDLVTTTEQASQIKCEFNYDQEMDWDDLSGEIKINLYRIVQEGLQNCVKYSDAQLIELSLDTQGDQITARLEDNGVGFDSRKVKKGIGHKNISSRVAKLKGEWILDSNPGKGTVIKVIIPVVRRSHQPKDDKEQFVEKEILN